MNSLYPLITGEYIEGVTDLDRLLTPAILHIFRKTTKKYMKNGNRKKLSGEQKKKVRAFYRKYEWLLDLLYHRVYTARSGKFHPEYIPDDIYFKKIEPYYSDRLFSRAIDNKCFYYSFFSNVRQPELVVMRVGGFWLDSERNLITFETACELAASKSSIVCKRATMSEGGHGVLFLERNDIAAGFRDFVKRNQTDLVIQMPVEQHFSYAGLHRESVNTLRLMSLLTQDGVEVFAGFIRIGVGNKRVDNLSSGGICVGIRSNGHLREKGVLDDGRVVLRHPDLHYRFDEVVLPHYDKAVKLVQEAHGIMAHCRLVSWDIAIDASGEAVLIETNLSLATIHSTQVCCGPLFGKDTRNILDEVYFEKDGSRRKLPYFGMNQRDYYFLRDNFLGIFFGFYKAGYTNNCLLGNTALRHIDRKLIKKVLGMYPKLSVKQKKEIREYYKPYVSHVMTDSHRVYTGKSGKFLPEYLPEDMYMCDIDRYLSDRELAYYLDNKCYYYRLFPEAKQPEALVMRINGIWLDRDYQVISKKQVVKQVLAEDTVVIKAALCSEGGEGVSFLDFYQAEENGEKLEMFVKAIRSLKKDIVIQKTVRQHPELARLHPESLNTMRIVSLLIDNRVEILSRSLKIGAGKSRLDNGCSGGMYCGIRADGTLGCLGALDNGTVVTHHPDLGYQIEGIKVPCLEKCDAMIKRIHQVLGHHRLVSWDVAVDSLGDAVLIEANMGFGGSDDVQVVNGPFFGKYTKRVLEEVYGTTGKRRKN